MANCPFGFVVFEYTFDLLILDVRRIGTDSIHDYTEGDGERARTLSENVDHFPFLGL